MGKKKESEAILSCESKSRSSFFPNNGNRVCSIIFSIAPDYDLPFHVPAVARLAGHY
jgi:hypothetical protein